MFKTLCAGVLCAGLAASAALAAPPDVTPAEPAAPPPPAAAPADPAAWYVIAVHPDNVDLLLAHGTIGDDGDFDAAGQDETITPQSGFVVAKQDKDGRLAISGVMMESSRAYGTGLMGMLTHAIAEDHGVVRKERFYTCGRDSKTMSFTAQAGHVVYVGDFEFRLEDRGYWWPGNVEPHIGANIEAARTFLKDHYPELAGRLEMANVDARHISYGCSRR